MSPKNPSEDKVAAEAQTNDLEERFQEAIESGEIDGDTLLVDAQGREVKAKKPLVSIFDL